MEGNGQIAQISKGKEERARKDKQSIKMLAPCHLHIQQQG